MDCPVLESIVFQAMERSASFHSNSETKCLLRAQLTLIQMTDLGVQQRLMMVVFMFLGRESLASVLIPAWQTSYQPQVQIFQVIYHLGVHGQLALLVVVVEPRREKTLSAKGIQLGVLVNSQETAIKTNVQWLHPNLPRHPNGRNGRHAVHHVEVEHRQEGVQEQIFPKLRDAISKVARQTQVLAPAALEV